MSTPSVDISVLDNQLGIRAPVDTILAIIATAEAGAIATPQLFADKADVVAEHTSGPLVEAAAYAIERYGLQTLCIRADEATAGDYGTIDLTGVTGTCIPGETGTPTDETEVVVTVSTGGTIGAAGIEYTYSMDGGRNTRAKRALGTAVSISLESGVSFYLAPPAAQVAALVTLVNDLRADFLAHFILTSGSVHGAADTTSDDGIGAAASDGPTALTLVNQLRAGALLHFARGSTVHLTADITNGSGIGAAATTTQGAIDLAIALKTAYNAHRVDNTYHTGDDTTNITTAADPTKGTLVAGDTWTITTTAPAAGTTELDAALTALGLSPYDWKVLEVYGDMSSSLLSTLEAQMGAMETDGIPRRAVAHTRKPNSGESESTYKAAMNTAFGSDAAPRVVLCSGWTKTDSSVARYRYRRPLSLALAPLIASIAVGRDPAEQVFQLPGVYLRDANGNPDDHDELASPGLDDLRFATARTWRKKTGVYVNNARLFSALGSDFLYIQHGRVIDLACEIAREELEPILSTTKDPKTDGSGQLATHVADTIDSQVTSALRNALVGTGNAADAAFTISRTDNVLQTGQVTWKVRVVPLIYIKKATGTVALTSSIQTSTVAS